MAIGPTSDHQNRDAIFALEKRVAELELKIYKMQLILANEPLSRFKYPDPYEVQSFWGREQEKAERDAIDI